MSLLGQLQQLNGGSVFVGFELDATNHAGGPHVYFHAGTNEFNTAVVWQGITYQPFPIECSGFEWDSTKVTRPKMTISNVSGYISALCEEFDDLVNAKIIRRSTKVQNLDAVNFVGGNPSADPEDQFPDELWFITQKLSENKNVVEFELGSPLDLQDKSLPNRQVIANSCPWQYRGEGCNYSGGAVATDLDVATTDLALDKCGKRLTSCALRFGNSPLPFGGFPGSALVTR